MGAARKKGRPSVERDKPQVALMVPQVLAQNGGNLTKTGADLGISRETVKAILRRSPEAWAAAQKTVAAHALNNADRFSRAITDEKIDRLNGLQLAIAAKVSGQHALEMLGQSPQGVQVNIALVSESMRRLQDLRSVVSVTNAPTLNPNGLGCDDSPAESPDSAGAVESGVSDEGAAQADDGGGAGGSSGSGAGAGAGAADGQAGLDGSGAGLEGAGGNVAGGAGKGVPEL